ncbi:Mannan endo-1,4-beta-mannosidase 7 [Camellia lanceoleosa]|uniref:Mannan endo-1,4-beta-mannosidase 7 n=1 Tax=Camellia lanceoleosa TaxID=1840588 RepID=A0ACC0IGR9_9ERIC|nr:Mannan endo-1,4-beta-mannosidase 7 [Camellia lanceoleosa]
MRKKAQERKMAMSPPSNSSSSVSNNPPVDSMPFMETKERSFYDTGGDHDQMLTPMGINKGFEEEESTATGYSMDDIWEDIALSESDTMKTTSLKETSVDLTKATETVSLYRNKSKISILINANGFNAYWLIYLATDPTQRDKVSSVFQQASNHGLTLARTWGFSDGGYRALHSIPPDRHRFDLHCSTFQFDFRLLYLKLDLDLDLDQSKPHLVDEFPCVDFDFPKPFASFCGGDL